MLDAIASQTRPPDVVLVVDNDPHCSAQDVAADGTGGLHIRYLRAGANIGPAGGVALAMREALEVAGDDGWLLLLDDDNPPRSDDDIASLLAFAERHDEPALAGVGVTGAHFNRRRGRSIRLGDDDLAGAIDVDVIAGGQLPLYRLASVRIVGTPRPELFWGFEELEYGLRMRAAGRRLLVDGPALRERRRRSGRLGLSKRPSLRIDTYSWRDFYTLRNLLVIMLEHGRRRDAARVALVRGLVKPVVNLPRSLVAWDALRWNTLAIRDAFTGRLGRTLEPERLPARP